MTIAACLLTWAIGSNGIIFFIKFVYDPILERSFIVASFSYQKKSRISCVLDDDIMNQFLFELILYNIKNFLRCRFITNLEISLTRGISNSKNQMEVSIMSNYLEP